MITFEIIGERIKEKRESLKMSQKELATLLIEVGLNISRETVSKIENGSRATNVIEIKAISKILGITAEEIMHEEEENGLVSLFRSRGEELSDAVSDELEDIQGFIKSIIAQKKIDIGEIKIKRFEPSWR